MVRIPRGWAWFLVAAGVWNWVIWPRFALAIWDDPRAWATRVVGHGTPTSFLWVHAVLIIVSLAVGTAVGVLGIRALLQARRGEHAPTATDHAPTATPATSAASRAEPRSAR